MSLPLTADGGAAIAVVLFIATGVIGNVTAANASIIKTTKNLTMQAVSKLKPFLQLGNGQY